jgi:hypothetical protein
MPWERQCLHWPLSFPEVFLEDGRSGFDAMVANPPFLGGKRISGAHGGAYREHLVGAIAGGDTGNADLVSYFLLRMLAISGRVGSLATNTVSQGDTREVGLDRVLSSGLMIHRAVKSEPWPNTANLEIAKVWIGSTDWTGAIVLNGQPVSGITASLERTRRVAGPPHRLLASEKLSFIGCALNTMGFILRRDEARDLIAATSRNRDVVLPYLSGQDLNDDPTQMASRWSVNFRDWPEDRAREYSEPYALVETRVKPEVLDKKGYPGWAIRWWQFWRPRAELYEATANLDDVVAIARVSGTVIPALVNARQTFHDKTVVFATDSMAFLALMTSSFHSWWVFRWSSTLGGLGNINYSPSDVFETFPWPLGWPSSQPSELADVGASLNEFRAALMARTNRGLTKTYSVLHNSDEHDPDIVRLRELHVELDHAVRDAYGWSDLALDHHHWEAPQGMRFTVSPAAKDELLDRLLELNHERYAAEVAAGLHDKKRSKGAARGKRGGAAASRGQGSLL